MTVMNRAHAPPTNALTASACDRLCPQGGHAQGFRISMRSVGIQVSNKGSTAGQIRTRNQMAA
ncbi:hypothetical protein HY523_02520 [Candidatus Berkelbacteria bacterium]|nr:hypothetical protein [Candidatus Berkelbacteria bacterium]